MTILSNWHFMRILRAGIAIWAIFEFARTSDWMLLMIGGFFGFQAIFNTGCCGPSGCSTSPKAQNQNFTIQDVDYEEIK